MKTFLYILISLVWILSSCSTNKFLNRKYTSGIWVEKSREIKRQTYNTQEVAISNPQQEWSSQAEDIPCKDSIETKCDDTKDSIIIVQSPIKLKTKPYANIMKHNTILSDPNVYTCSSDSKTEINIIRKPTKHIEKQIVLKQKKSNSDESLWSFLLHELGNTFIKTIIILAVIIAVVGLIQLTFSPSVAFWIALLSLVFLAGLIIKIIQNVKTSTSRKTNNPLLDKDAVKDTLAHIGVLAIEFTLALVLSR